MIRSPLRIKMTTWTSARLILVMSVALLLSVPLETLRAQVEEDNPESDPQRPNIILIMADDLGWGDPAYNGNHWLSTPHLDSMAQDGLRLNRFYAAAPVCSPTRASCLTGLHPYRQGIYSANTGHLLPTEQSLAKLLAELGYRTGHFGKWHLGTLTTTEQDSQSRRATWASTLLASTHARL